jgi:hypothetical protein
MWFVIILLLNLLFPISLAAQVFTVPVRGGEHVAYTRLVIALPDGINWTFSQAGREGRLVVAGGEMRFDTSQTFTRIPRTRLSSLRDNGNGLLLELACDCVVRASEDLAQMLVLDIQSATVSRTEAAIRPMPRPEPLVKPFAVAQRAGTATAHAMRNSSENQIFSTASVELPAASILAPKAMPIPELSNNTVQHHIRSDVLTALTDAVAVAVGQGLLAAQSQRETLQHQNPNTNADGAGAYIPIEQHISVIDSVAQARGPLGQSKWPDEQDKCPDTDIFFSEDPDALPVGQRLLANIFDDYGAPVADKLREIAKLSIRNALGLEARMFLAVLPEMNEQDELLLQFSYLMDLEPAPEPALVSALAYCQPFGAMWSILAILPERISNDELIAQAVLQMATLPSDLRVHLGPYVLRHLAAQDHAIHAYALRDILLRIGPAPSPQQGAINDKLSVSFSGLGTDLTKESPIDPTEMLRMLQLAGARAEPISPLLLEIALEQIFAFRGSNFATALGREVVMALAMIDEFKQALDLVVSPDITFEQAEITILRSEVMLQLVARAQDDLFLSLTFEQNPWRERLTPTATVKVADRLHALGFAEAAEKLRRQGQQSDTLPSDFRHSTPDLQGNEPSALKGSPAITNFVTEPDPNAAISQPQQSANTPSTNSVSILSVPSLFTQSTQGENEFFENVRSPVTAESQGSDNRPSESMPIVEDDSISPIALSQDYLTESESAPTLLGQSRQALEESANLRNRLRTLLDQ